MLSLRDVSEILTQRGIILTYESIREWGNKFGPQYAAEIKRRSPRRGDKWYMDEMCIVLKGIKFWLWRAVDQDGYELDILLQSKRDKKAAKKFFKKLLKGLKYTPRAMITDKLKSYSSAKKEIMPRVEHRQHKGINNRAENSHQPTRQQEKQMRKFKSPKQVQQFLSRHGPIHNLFSVAARRYKETAKSYRNKLATAFKTWNEIILQVSCA
jgi:putative transposase